MTDEKPLETGQVDLYSISQCVLEYLADVDGKGRADCTDPPARHPDISQHIAIHPQTTTRTLPNLAQPAFYSVVGLGMLMAGAEILFQATGGPHYAGAIFSTWCGVSAFAGAYLSLPEESSPAANR